MIGVDGDPFVTTGAEEDDPPQPIITSENAVRAEMPRAFRSFGLRLFIEPPKEGVEKGLWEKRRMKGEMAKINQPRENPKVRTMSMLFFGK